MKLPHVKHLHKATSYIYILQSLNSLEGHRCPLSPMSVGETLRIWESHYTNYYGKLIVIKLSEFEDIRKVSRVERKKEVKRKRNAHMPI